MLLPLQVSLILDGLDIVFELILNVLPFLDHFIVLYAMLD